MKRNARQVALDALLQVETGQGYSNLVIDKTLKRDILDPRDAALATTLFYGALERRISLDYYLERFSKPPLSQLSPRVLAALRIAAYQILYLDKIPASAAVNEAVNCVKADKRTARAAGFVNGVLRSLLRGKEAVSLPDPARSPLEAESVEFSCPVWLLRLWHDAYGDGFTREMLQAFMEPPNLYIRANTCRISPGALQRRLAEEGVPAELVPDVPGALLLGRSGAVDSLPSFQEGLFHVQDLSSQLCCAMLDPKPGQTVLDVCAAPGGKTFTLAQRMENTGRVLAFDLHKAKVGLIRQGARRLGLSCVEAAVRDAAHPGEELPAADAVLCDVPCAGLGILRRKPEIRYKNPEDIQSLPAVQKQILAESAKCVRVGGILLYSTCSLNPAENRAVADWFEETHPEFVPDPLCLPAGQRRGIPEPPHQWTLFPHVNGTDGFFVARFCRRG